MWHYQLKKKKSESLGFENTLNFPSAMLEVQLKLLSYTLFRKLYFKIIVIGRSKEHAPKL